MACESRVGGSGDRARSTAPGSAAARWWSTATAPSLPFPTAPSRRSCSSHRDEITFHDTWHVAGLKGTGSTDYSVDDAFAPEGRWVQVAGTPRIDRPLYRFSFMGALAVGVAAVGLGLARRAVDELVDMAGGKKPQGSSKTLAERAAVQAVLGEADAGRRAARHLLDHAIADAWEQAATGATPPTPIGCKVALRQAATHAMTAAASVRRRLLHGRRRIGRLRDVAAAAGVPRRPRRHPARHGRAPHPWRSSGATPSVSPPTSASSDEGSDLMAIAARADVRSWLREHPTPAGAELAAAGLVAPHYPEPWGLGADPELQLAVDEELAPPASAIPDNPIGIGWAGPDAGRRRHARAAAALAPRPPDGDDFWCQLFSEPEAGSDLASLRTTAVRDGDHYVVNGQKIWSTWADRSAFGILLARTDPDGGQAPRHQLLRARHGHARASTSGRSPR